MIINMNGAKAPETPSSVLQEKTVTPETLPTVIGPDEGYDGLSQVTVNPDSQLKAENIRSGKTIFGVAGAFVGESTTKDVTALPIGSEEMDGHMFCGYVLQDWSTTEPTYTNKEIPGFISLYTDWESSIVPAFVYADSCVAVCARTEKIQAGNRRTYDMTVNVNIGKETQVVITRDSTQFGYSINRLFWGSLMFQVGLRGTPISEPYDVTLRGSIYYDTGTDGNYGYVVDRFLASNGLRTELIDLHGKLYREDDGEWYVTVSESIPATFIRGGATIDFSQARILFGIQSVRVMIS